MYIIMKIIDNIVWNILNDSFLLLRPTTEKPANGID